MEGVDLGEGRFELVAGGVFGVDLDPLEERLVEESAFGRLSVEVGLLDVVGEFQREVERGDDLVVVDLEALDELVSGDAFAADALLLLGEDVVRDPIGVVRGEQLPLFRVKSRDFDAGAGGLLVGDRGEVFDVRTDGGADAVAVVVGELNSGVVALDRGLDGLDAVVGLAAGRRVAEAMAGLA